MKLFWYLFDAVSKIFLNTYKLDVKWLKWGWEWRVFVCVSVRGVGWVWDEGWQRFLWRDPMSGTQWPPLPNGPNKFLKFYGKNIAAAMGTPPGITRFYNKSWIHQQHICSILLKMVIQITIIKFGEESGAQWSCGGLGGDGDNYPLLIHQWIFLM